MKRKLRQYRIHLERVPDGEDAIDREQAGQRSKLGGTPDWEQDDETPSCPSCKQGMSFVAQIDSVEHDQSDNPHRIDCMSSDQQFMFGDVGLIYVFLCFECLQTKAIVQCG